MRQAQSRQPTLRGWKKQTTQEIARRTDRLAVPVPTITMKEKSVR